MKWQRAEGGATHLFATWGIAGFVAFACVALVGLETSRVVAQRSEVVAGARIDTTNLTHSLIQQAELIFRSADAILTGMVERLEHGELTLDKRERLRTWLLKELQLSPQFASFAITDQTGKILLSTVGETDAPQLTEREYFIYHRDHDDMAIHIGSPIRGRSGWIIPVTRRFDNADGTFGGVAIAAINLQYFQNLYDGLEIGRNGVVALTTTETGQILVRRPFVESNVGRDLSKGGIFRALKKSPKGTNERISDTDGVLRLNSYEQGHTYPIVVNVAQDMDEVLAPWRRNALESLLETAGIAAAILLMGAFAWRAARTLSRNSVTLRATNDRFDAALANMPPGLSMFDADGKLLVWNTKFLDLYGMSPDVVHGGADIHDIVAHRNQIRGGLETDVKTYVAEFRKNLLKDGKSIIPQRLENGRTISITNTAIAGGGWVGIHEDITERVRDEEALFQKSAELARINLRFDTALSHMTQGLCMFDENKRLVVWNRRYAELYDVPAELLKVGTPYELIVTDRVSRGWIKADTSPEAVKAKVAELSNLPRDSRRIDELADGRFVQLSRQPMPGGGWLSMIEDITERRRAEAEIVHLARHDVLTGLANRAEFNERLDEVTRRSKQCGAPITIMMLDLDKFKAVNDTLGHPVGDLLLAEVGRRLKSTIRESDLLARLGGDEFAIIQQGTSNQHESAIALALRIVNAIAKPFDLNGHEASIGVSIGITMAPEHGSEPEELLKHADLALYEAKASGRNDFRIYNASMLEVVHTQQSAEDELRQAIANREFEMHYQPVVEMKTGLVCGVEALVRWRHPTKGLIEPDHFIPLAESTGLMNPLGEWILQQACKDAVSWPEHIKLAINISVAQLNKGNLLEVILCALVESGLAPERLEFEVTETSLLDNRETHLATIRQLKNLGISIALDNFGTGYASVTCLTNFPFDKIKIDRDFTKDALNRRDYAAVVFSVLALAHGLGVIATVEGVETEQQFEYMRQAGADLAQGDLFGRPVPLSQLNFNAQPLSVEKVMVA
jgi:diguanylate cyclase (GGDEF)-like protein/PAS domain S-box-containing protein